jgi:hypothetical protein
MRPIHGWGSRTPAGVLCGHFYYCNHNIRGSGLKWKNRWRWLYDALIIYCVARMVAEPLIWPKTFARSWQQCWTVSLRTNVPPACKFYKMCVESTNVLPPLSTPQLINWPGEEKVKEEPAFSYSKQKIESDVLLCFWNIWENRKS